MPVAIRIACFLCVLGIAASATAQPLVPLEEDILSPLLPTGILPHDVTLDGRLAYLWRMADDTEVIHIIGDFQLTVGDRKLSADQAVAWMSARRYEERDYRSFEVFLYRNARVTEAAGTTTEGPLLFVTLSSFGDVTVSADRRTFSSSAETTLYHDAASVRDTVRARSFGEALAVTAPLTVVPQPTRVPPPPPVFSFSADEVTVAKIDDDHSVMSLRGQTSVFSGPTPDGSTLELQADAAVLFVVSTGSDAGGVVPLIEGGGGGVEAVYVEGDIRLHLGDRTIRAERAYYDLVENKALILDAVAFSMLPDRNLPIYVRAARIHQLSEREYAADKAMLTTSEFHTPHYHIGAERLELVDNRMRGLFDDGSGLSRASYKIEHATLRLSNVPILYWPRAAGNVAVSESALRRVSAGHDDVFGTRVETKWDFFSLLSFEPPEGTTAELTVDYFSDRGLALGLDVDYERDTYFGLARGYTIDDDGKDSLGALRDNDPDKSARRRVTWRHRHYLPDDWELTLELSHISDRAFLEEFFETEFDTDKDQETLVYLKKQRENWAFTALGQWRLNDFDTQTERLPDFSFRVVGEPVGRFGSWYSENRAGFVRYRAAPKELLFLLTEGSDGPSSGATARVDSRQEIGFPFSLGPVKLVPFVSLRASAWDDTPRDRFFGNDQGGGRGRFMATYGLRSGMYLSRVFPDAYSQLFDVSGIRHIIHPEVVAWGSHGNLDSDELFPFDKNVEGIDDFDGLLVAVRQRLQTKRGPVDERRIVDWIKLDLEFGLFNDGRSEDITNGYVSYTRPEESVSRNFINAAFTWRVSDATVLLSEMNYDLNDREVDVFDIAVQVDRSPRFSYGIDYRFIDETNSNLLGFGMNYKVDRKHTLAFREAFDLQRGRTLDFTVAYIRKYPRWYVGLIFELDEAEDNAGLSLTFWPEGLPRTAVGTRRFTGLATSTAMQDNR